MARTRHVRPSVARTRLMWRCGMRPHLPGVALRAIFVFSAERRLFLLISSPTVPFREKKNRNTLAYVMLAAEARRGALTLPHWCGDHRSPVPIFPIVIHMQHGLIKFVCLFDRKLMLFQFGVRSEGQSERPCKLTSLRELRGDWSSSAVKSKSLFCRKPERGTASPR